MSSQGENEISEIDDVTQWCDCIAVEILQRLFSLSGAVVKARIEFAWQLQPLTHCNGFMIRIGLIIIIII